MHIRAFTGGDLNPLSRLVGSTWHAEQGGHALWCGGDEACYHLARADQGFVAVDDEDAILGAILLASARAEDRNPEMRNHWRQQRTVMATMAKAFGVDLQPQTAELTAETALVQRAAATYGTDGVGEVVLVIVAPEARGQGIGRALLHEGLSWLQEHGAADVRLVTDTDCDWQLYEHLGMARLEQGEVPGTGIGIYLYQAEIAKLLARVDIGGAHNTGQGLAALAILPATEELDQQIGALLDAHAEAAGVQFRSYRYRIERDGQLLAGISAWAMGPDVHIDMLAVSEDVRGQGLGARLLAQVEERARLDGCTTASVDTFSFQAPDYYPAQGYTEVFRQQLDDGSEHIYFTKRLA